MAVERWCLDEGWLQGWSDDEGWLEKDGVVI